MDCHINHIWRFSNNNCVIRSWCCLRKPGEFLQSLLLINWVELDIRDTTQDITWYRSKVFQTDFTFKDIPGLCSEGSSQWPAVGGDLTEISFCSRGVWSYDRLAPACRELLDITVKYSHHRSHWTSTQQEPKINVDISSK